MEGLKFLLPQVPSLASTAFWHTLGRTPTASQWDLRTELTVQIMRCLMNGGSKPTPVGEVQAFTLKDPGVKGKMWVATATVKASEAEGAREAVFRAIEEMKPAGVQQLNYTKPELADLEVEWTGYRHDAGKDDPLPNISEQDKYARLMAEPTRTSDTTILYFHGGAYYMCDPATHRAMCSQLAKHSKGRVCSVRYRLSPKTAFPGQLLDGLMVYLSLLYPPPGSMHEAVPPNNIVFAGDSAGGNLSCALLQLLLQFHRASPNPTLNFHGKDVAVPLPAGVTANSAWLDIGRCLPSLTTNDTYDYLPAPNDLAAFHFPHDSIWPSQPVRGDLFCDLSLLDHPLASPLMADSWANSPPMWFCTGKELLQDEINFVVSKAAAQGVRVQYEDYEAMPHVFAMLLEHLPASKRCAQSWGDFCRRCVEEPTTLKTDGKLIHARSGKEEDVDINAISTLSSEEVTRLVRETKERKIGVFEREKQRMERTKATL